MHKLLSDDPLEKLVYCHHCGRLVKDGDIEVNFSLEPPFIHETCPYCHGNIKSLPGDDEKTGGN